MDYVGARGYFNFIAGYGDLPNEAISTKADMIRNELKNFPGVRRTVMIGDGIPDVVAGKETGCYTIGIVYGDSTKQEQGIRDAKPDEVVKYGEFERIYDVISKLASE